jgi:predicted transcriptional regulator of viral defense system
MKYLELRNQLADFTIFSLTDIRKLEPTFNYRRLYEWKDKGYIDMVRRGYYVFSDTPLTENSLFLIANHLYTPSYVSLETALNYYNLIPEGVYSTTSVTTNKTQTFNHLVSFSYQHIKASIFFGYRLDRTAGQNYKIAEPEKAVLDYLYLHPTMSDQASLAEWRFNTDEFRAIANTNKFYGYLKLFDSKSLDSRVKKFVKHIGGLNVKS